MANKGEPYIDIIIYLAQDWRSYSSKVKGYFTEVPFIRAMAKVPGIRILCVNRPITPIETSVKKPRKIISWVRGERGLRMIEEKLFIYTPFAFLHDMVAPYIPGMENLNRRVLSYQISKQLERLGFNSLRRVSWIFYPTQYNYFGLVNEGIKVYECYSPYSLRANSKSLREKIDFYERKVLLNSDLVFCFDSNLLYEQQVKVNSNTHFMLAGVEFVHFAKALEDNINPPPDLTQIKSPKIGFVGTISGLIDMELINFLAERHPGWSLIMIGNLSSEGNLQNSEAFQKSRYLNNIYYLEFKEYEDLPAYYKYLDVCLLPYRTMEVMNHVFPHKTFQYLAAGKPVVSTNFPTIRVVKDTIRIANTYEEFAKMIEEALQDTSMESIEKRVNVARQNTWEDRAKKVYEIIIKQFKTFD